MPFATTIENSILDHFTGKQNWTAPAAIYVGFSSQTPDKGGGNVSEPTGGAYARVQFTAANFITAAGGATYNNTDKTWTAATADWLIGANLTHAVFYTASTAGTFLGFSALTTPRSVLNTETAKILVGELDLLFS